MLNVGAGAGSYEPLDRLVTAVEPSASMRAQRPAHLSGAIDAVAERLPFADGRFDASMATFAVYQRPDLRTGLAEIRRVTRGPVVVMSCDPDEMDRFWLVEYAPKVIAVEARLANSAWGFVQASVSDRFAADLERDLGDGMWDARHRHLRMQPAFEGSLKLTVGRT